MLRGDLGCLRIEGVMFR